MAGYSGTLLVKKLGVKPGFRAFVQNVPEEYFRWLHPLPEDVSMSDRLAGDFDFMHFFVKDEKSLKLLLAKSIRHLKSNGMIWVSWPKRSSGVATDLDENRVREIGLNAGVVDVKVCAVDNVWSALKFVIRLKDR